jgi:solute:Na+ symporter, SSS family
MLGKLGAYDYAVLAFYFVFMCSMGWVFKRFVKNTSDYFRSGGEMLWWIVGAGAFMTNFSAVSFTGMAGKAYKDGPVVLVIFVAGALGFLCNLYFAPVFRQMRCVTAMDAVRKRFGAANEQFFTWIQIPLGIMYAAIWLNGLAVFLSAAFDMPLNMVIIGTALATLAVTLLGGSWTSTASDFVQMLLLMPVTVVAAVLALLKLNASGKGSFFQATPSHFWHWGEAANGNIITLWVIAIVIQKWISLNNMTDASRYLSVKDTGHARRAALLATILFLVGPMIWFIPPMVTRVFIPPDQLAAMFPNLKNPQDVSYFAIATQIMPAGMLGLLVSGIFASTMGQMDTGLNRNAGYFIKNFYQLHWRPQASERELLNASKVATVVFALLIIAVSLWFASLKNVPIFNLMVNFGSWVALPVAIPLIWGMFVRNAPSWAGWSSVLVGLASSLFVQYVLTASRVGAWFGHPMTGREPEDWGQAAGILLNTVIGSAWFFGTTRFGKTRDAAETRRVDAFFTDMATPVDFAKEEGGPGSDNLQAKTMGMMCLIYGAFILLLCLIPNDLKGRGAFLFCGAVMFGVGGLLWKAGRSKKARVEAAARFAPGTDVEPEPPEVALPLPRRKVEA